MTRSAIVLLLLTTCTVTMAAASGTATVIGMQGQGAYRTDRGWQPLQVGTVFPADAFVRAAPGGSVRLLLEDGAMVRIADGEQRPARDPGAAARRQQAGGLFGMLREMFSSERRELLAGSRAATGGLPVRTWEALMAEPRLVSTQAAVALSVASVFDERPLQNRSVALLLKLAEDHPGSPGYERLAAEALRALDDPATLAWRKQVGRRVDTLSSGDRLRSGDGVQLRYVSETESFVYVFARTLPAGGAARTDRLYPVAAAGGLAAEHGQVFPAEGQFYRLDEEVGIEYLWAWSCLARLPEGAVDSALRAMEERIAAKRGEGDVALAAVAPRLCPQSWAMRIVHE